jgi:hypothetical protein
MKGECSKILRFLEGSPGAMERLLAEVLESPDRVRATEDLLRPIRSYLKGGA